MNSLADYQLNYEDSGWQSFRFKRSTLTMPQELKAEALEINWAIPIMFIELMIVLGAF